MATDVEKLVVQLSADIKQYQREMERARGVTNRQMRAVQREHEAVAKKIQQIWATAGKGVALLSGALGVGFSLGAGKELIDTATGISNALKVAGLSGSELKSVYDDLFASAQKNAVPIEALVQLYSKLSLTQKELGATQPEMKQFVDSIGLALRVGGTDTVQASGALQQLSQALAGGTVRAEEFQSLIEGAPTILQAAADGIEEAAGSVTKLRNLMLSGDLSSAALFQGVIAGTTAMEEKVKDAEGTISQAMVRFRNTLVDVAGEFNKVTGAGDQFAAAIDNLTSSVAGFGAQLQAVANSDIGAFIGWINTAIERASLFRQVMGGIPGIINKMGQINQDIFQGKPLGTSMKEDAIQNRIDQAFEDPAAPKTGRLPAAPEVTPPPVVKPISIKDYPVSPAPKKGSGGSGGSGGGRKGGGGGRSTDDYQQLVDRIKERTAAIEMETAAQATLNPLIEDYGLSQERASIAGELLTAAKQKGTAAGKELSSVEQLLKGDFENLSPAAREQAEAMLALATKYGEAEAASTKLAEAQRANKQAVEAFRDGSKDVARGLVDDLMNGVKASEALANALKKVGDMLLDSALNSLLNGGGGSGGGIFGSIIGTIFGGGGGGGPGAGMAMGGIKAAGGGKVSGPGTSTSDSIPAQLSNGEFVVNAAATKQNRRLLEVINAGRAIRLADGGAVDGSKLAAPLLPALPKSSSGSTVSAPVNITINAPGADKEGLARVERQVATLKAELPARTVDAVRKARKRGERV
ncbi:tape measure protein [Rhizobium sp. PP-CC-3G-465]|uniref:tape measure protein n=1 Tax=Rhizobium sp. PP-CC-3G-465 TaxID=2135648 RepID=UPI0010452725|nr:tape measure domain-containing protein [Rhizobium sp. PP-CC-3G-465]